MTEAVGSNEQLFFIHPVDKQIVLFPNLTAPKAWAVLNKGEECRVGVLTPEVRAWFHARTGMSLDEDVGDGEDAQLTLIYNSRNPAQSRVIHPAISRIIDDPTARKPYETLEGREELRQGDTPLIRNQKQVVRMTIDPLIHAMVSDGTAARLTTIGDKTICLCTVTEQLSSLSIIQGDPDAEAIDLQNARALLTPGKPLVFEIDSGGNVRYITPAYGKAQVLAPDMAGLRLGTIGQTVGQQLDQAGLRMHKSKIIAEMTRRMVGEFTVPTFEEIIGRHFDRIPPKLKEHLENIWLPAQCEVLTQVVSGARGASSGRQSRAEGVITDSGRAASVPSPRNSDGTTNYYELGRLDESLISFLLTQTPETWDSFIVQHQIVTDHLSSAAEDMLLRAGAANLEQAAINQLLHEGYRHWSSVGLENIVLAINTFPPSLQQKCKVHLALFEEQQLDNETRQRLLARLISTQLLSTLLYEMGMIADESTDYSNLPLMPVIDYDRVFSRAERLIETEGGTFDRLIALHTGAMDQHGISDTMYDTPHIRERAARLRKRGLEGMARVPWRLLEATMEIPHRELYINFMSALTLIATFVKHAVSDPYRLAQDAKYPPGSPEYEGLMSLCRAIAATITFKVPDYLPQGGRLNSPLVLTRPDFARILDSGGQVRMVATELESAPGGLGMQRILHEGHSVGEQSNAVQHIVDMMQEIRVPKGCNRNYLTILMTEEWSEYRPDLLVLQNEMETKHGINVRLVTLEELMESDDSSLESGFVFHFAYPWNFIKDPARYYVNVLLKPERVAAVLGIPLENVLKSNFIGINGAVDRQALEKELNRIREETNVIYKLTGIPPMGLWEERLKRYIYCDDIYTIRNGSGNTLIEASKAIAEKMKRIAMGIYDRQGKDLMIFNDPWLSGFVHSKLGMAVFSIPGCMDVITKALGRMGFDQAKVEQMMHSFSSMVASSNILKHPNQTTGDETLDRHLDTIFIDAWNHRENWVLKLAVDPQFGMYDWGARGVFMGAKMGESAWQALLLQASDAEIPYILQRLVNNVPYDEPRTGEDFRSRRISATGCERVAIFVDEPETYSKTGELLLVPRAGARVNPFLTAYLEPAKNGHVVARAGNGIVTVTPVGKGEDFVKVHGATNAAMAPAIFVD